MMSSITKHLILLLHISLFSIQLSGQGAAPSSAIESAAKKVLLPYIQKQAIWAMEEQPITVTASTSSRSSGGKHDFFSEGDYFVFNGQSDSAYLYRQNQLIYKWKPLLGTFDFFGSKGQLREKHKL